MSNTPMQWPSKAARSIGSLVWVLAVGLMIAPPPDVLADDNPSPSSQPATSPSDMKLASARAKIKAKQYEAAIPLLQEVVAADGRNADAHNLLGYSNRKLGRYPDASKAYGRALSLDPKHKGALEYQGELFLKLGQLDKAEKNLERLDSICWLGCEEYTDLKESIAAYKKKRGS
ncbi:MAG: tetratricopeptide repeat protein [Alphaproteobacteria bacterium]|nr:tetratricopeptide repeat protein [Alphaproteobacteria bacterium]